MSSSRITPAWLAAALVLSSCGRYVPMDAPPTSAKVHATQFSEGEALEPEDILIRLWANGSAVSIDTPRRILSFSIQATRDPETGLTLGTLFIADSINSVSFFGALTSGNLTARSESNPLATGGTGTFNGLLARQTPFTLAVADFNNPRSPDILQFIVPGVINFTGRVFRKDIRIVRAARPMEPFEEIPLGTSFDREIGLYVVGADGVARLGPQLPVPLNVLELTPPEPIIDFQRNRLGGMLQPPGDINNLPGFNGDVPAFVTPYFDPDAFPNNNIVNEEDDDIDPPDEDDGEDDDVDPPEEEDEEETDDTEVDGDGETVEPDPPAVPTPRPTDPRLPNWPSPRR